MKANLKMERSVEEVDLHFQMVKFMKENGKMIKKKEQEHIIMHKEQFIMDNGFKIKSMVKVEKYFLMDLNLKGYLKMEQNKVKDYFNGKMVLNIMGDLLTIKYLVKV